MRILSILAKFLVGTIVLLFLILLFVRSPWGQSIIKDRFVSFLINKTETNIQLDRVFLTFSGDLTIEHLYIEDKNQDTLLFSRSFTADIPIWPILTDRRINVRELNWEGVRINISRDEAQDFNYQFLIDAFAPSDTVAQDAPDSSQSSMEFSVGRVSLADVHARYGDVKGGIDADLDLGKLKVEMDQTDLKNMRFEVAGIAFENSRVRFIQTKPFPSTTDTGSAVMPFLTIRDTRINNVTALYHSIPDGIKAEVDIDDFLLDAPVVDLANNRIEIEQLALDRSAINVTTYRSPSESQLTISDHSDTSSMDLVWPDWQIAIDDLNLQENLISYVVDGAAVKPWTFNPDYVSLSGFTLVGDNIYLADQASGGELHRLSFEEASGMTVDQIQFEWGITDEQLRMTDVVLDALQSHVEGEILAQYPSILSLTRHPEQIQVTLDLPQIDLDLEQFYQFLPDLRANPYVQTLTQKSLSGSISAQGTMNKIRIHEFGLQWGRGTSMFASGTIDRPLEPDKLNMDFPNILFMTNRQDLNLFVPEDSMGIRYPDQSRLTAQVSGNLDNLLTNAVLESDLGQVHLAGTLTVDDTLAFISDLQLIELRLDSLLQNPALGPLTLTASATGQGQEIYSLNAELNATIDHFSWNNYPINDLTLSSEIINGAGNFHSAYQDSNFHIDLDGRIILDSISPEFEATFKVWEADLAAMSITDRKVNMAFELHTWFRGNGTEFEASASMDDGEVMTPDETFSMGKMDFNAYVTPDSTAGHFASRMLDFNLESNTSPMGFAGTIIDQVKTHLSDTAILEDTLHRSVRVSLDASVRQDPLLSEVFLPDLDEMESIQIFVNFQEEDQKLNALIEAPHLIYAGIEMDSIVISARSDPEYFGLDLGLLRVKTGPITINQTSLTNRIEDQILYTHFLASYQDKELIEFKTETSEIEDSLRVHLDPSVLVFDAKTWNVPSSNQIMIGPNKIRFESMNISRGNQLFSIDDNPGTKDLIVRFEQFNLANLIRYFNPDTLLATGILNGRVTIEEPLGDAGLVADLSVDSFHLLQVNMGLLELHGETEDAQDYLVNMSLSGGEVDLEAAGEYSGIEDDAEIQVDLRIDSITMRAIESFAGGAIENSTGYLAGSVEAHGMMSDIRYDGQIYFHQTRTTPTTLQTPFGLGTQEIVFNNEGIVLQDFTISDADGNTFVVDGEINTADLFNPSFDLTMEANDFQILDATREENDLYYGTASFDATARLTGDLNLPVLNLEIEVGEGTDVTYIMPQGQANLQSREGIVEFVDKEIPEEINAEEEEKESFVIQGYEVNALIRVRNEANFQVIISEATGDHFEISGDGDLSFGIDQSGQMTLTGLYTLEDGHYEMNLYNLVNRRFDIAQGSTVSWSGDPFDANIDVRAIYRIETSPASLMAGQTSGEDLAIQNQYRRRLPFLVYLNVDGRLTEPQLSFDLDMPEDAQGSMGGQVYGQIQRINQQEQEVNKQVFSLLVLNRFYPTTGNDGSSGGIVNVARNNLNQALSDQLNVFSDRLLGDTGFELNFGLDSYTDYGGQSPQTRTELDIAAQKNFLNDRLIINVGSEIDIEGRNTNPQEENPLIGNVSVEYLITENGQLRIRGFRKNVYENVIDGQTIISGLAIIFTKEFNKFHELWLPILTEENEENGAGIYEE